MSACPCGSELQYADCCQALHLGQRQAESALELMRSRYSAYCLGLGKYIYVSHHAKQRGPIQDYQLSPEEAAQWQGLEVLSYCYQAPAEQAWVEFKAYFKDANGLGILHERSHFVQEQGRWYYTSGEFAPKSLSKNSQCLCGSGKKFKQCCANNLKK